MIHLLVNRNSERQFFPGIFVPQNIAGEIKIFALKLWKYGLKTFNS